MFRGELSVIYPKVRWDQDLLFLGLIIIVLVHWTGDRLQLVLHFLGGGSLFLINKVSGTIFTHRLVILIKGVVHDWMVIRAGERSFVNYLGFHYFFLSRLCPMMKIMKAMNPSSPMIKTRDVSMINSISSFPPTCQSHIPLPSP